MKNRDFKNNLRLMTILNLLLFQLPGQFRFFISKNGNFKPDNFLTPLFFSICLIGFLLLEVWEYKKWNYRYTSAFIPGVLFLTRILLLVSTVLMTHTAPSHPGIISYLALLIFYSYYILPFSFSLALCIISPLVIMIREFVEMDFSGGSGQYSLFFATYKSLIMVMFYLFAYFWKKDRDISDENIQLVMELNHSDQQLRDYAQRIGQTVALEERTRLARDIHDSVGHALTAIQIQLSKAEAFFAVNSEESRSAIGEAKESAREAMQDIRSSLGMLNEKDLRFSLRDNIQTLLGKVETAGYSVDLSYSGEEAGYNYAVIMAVYRMIQEGITNILRHSKASHIHLSIEFGGDEVSAELQDDGIGFHYEKDDPERGKHYGLDGLKSRLELVRGKLDVISEPGSGTCLSAKAPKDPVSLIGEHHE